MIRTVTPDNLVSAPDDPMNTKRITGQVSQEPVFYDYPEEHAPDDPMVT